MTTTFARCLHGSSCRAVPLLLPVEPAKYLSPGNASEGSASAPSAAAAGRVSPQAERTPCAHACISTPQQGSRFIAVDPTRFTDSRAPRPSRYGHGGWFSRVVPPGPGELRSASLAFTNSVMNSQRLLQMRNRQTGQESVHRAHTDALKQTHSRARLLGDANPVSAALRVSVALLPRPQQGVSGFTGKRPAASSRCRAARRQR